MRATPNLTRFAAVESYCRTISADLWFLTETHEDLAPKQGYNFRFSGAPDRIFEEGERWSSIWSKWQIQPLDEYISDPVRTVAGRIPETPFGEIIAYATVLPWNTDPRAKESSSFQAFAEALEVQKSDWLKIQGDFPKATLIVTGDFNQGLVDYHFYGSKKKRLLLESALKECHLEAMTAGANDPIARDSFPRANIDHICITSPKDWELEETVRWPDSKVPVKSLSDHFGVRVELSI